MKGERDRRRRMLRSDRLRTIADLARESGSIRVSDLSDRLGVTEVTIRRDLARLAEAGVVRREHGGAVAMRGVESQYALRAGEQQEAKRAIARRAAGLVADGATIVIDSGSTTAEFARELVHRRNLRVVTNAITTAAEVAENPDATIILTGGVFRRSTRGTVGDIAVRTLSALRADQAFIAAAGVAVDGLSYPALEEVRWVQEEPANQGAWPFMALSLPDVIGRPLTRVSRDPSSSPAVGSHQRHDAEQRALVQQAFA